MWKQGGKAHFSVNRSSALERAKVQLSGQRITSSIFNPHNPGRDAFNASLGSNLLQSRQTPVQDLSELFSDTESENHHHVHFVDVARHSADPQEQFGSGGGSRFLKKSANMGAPSSTPADTAEVRFGGSQSVALSRLASIEDRIRNRKQKIDPGTGVELESGLSVQSSSELSGGGGSRFLKNEVSSQKSERKPAGPRVNSGAGPVRHVSLDSDEEDMRKLLGESLDSRDESDQSYRKISDEAGVSTALGSSAFTSHHGQKTPSASASPYSSPKIPSPSRPLSRRAEPVERSLSSASGHSEIRSLEELFPISAAHDDTQSDISVQSDDFKLNVMTLDDLSPVCLDIAGASKEKTKSSPSISRRISESSPGQESQEDPAPYPSDFESEIPTETARSADEISERLSDSPAADPQSGSFSVRSEKDEDDTLSEEPPGSESRRRGVSESSLSHSSCSETPSYSSGFTVSHTETRSPDPRRTRKDATVQTQADGLTYTWSSGQAVLGPSLGMSYVDPTPVASHMVSAEAIEALSAYSPAVVALNDMLKQQLALTRSFIQSSRYLHQTMLESLGPADYRYTTLEDTKKFIRCNRPPKLTMEDALEEVLQEMRDYHYI
ncbi:uncharacterized protein C19orf44 homolog [Trichomycterus rosablanca]|uniref:uncharacterized protein C19orf44 homolog n=1 Tax=Trichomycterus rosablanca TaxID=2290929 RepID=UPI002F3588DF